ncbi:type II secretion system minor pseudopilin GspK [Alteromonas sp. 14N.309.X.WAT.G.H12]|uniref:type II secretion system minor pseudopilin GspK n=1 Tax=Alteromonas sp. 14N.309.X.WAT.G.H12 TaxID=3120824 RepID=UPI002FD161C9
MRMPSQQRGVALLIVLMIVALVVIIASEMGTRLQIQVQRTINIKDNNQAYWYALGAEAYARTAIATLLDETDDKVVLSDDWAQEFTYPVENGVIKAQLEDAQSCFNLNAVSPSDEDKTSQSEASEEMEAFGLMLEAAGDDIDSYTAETVRDSLADWLDSDTSARTYGAEDSDYESLEHPYLAANSQMTNQSELRLINGVSPTWLNDILPLICVIPDETTLAINVNTLTVERAPILAGLTGLSLAQASNLISSRSEDGWSTVDDFLSEPTIEALDLSDTQRDWFTITTKYFMLHIKTSYNNATFSLTSLLSAESGESVEVIRREFGGVK